MRREAVGLGDQIGTLTPGKYADLIAIRAEDLNNMPVNNAIGTIVLSTEKPKHRHGFRRAAGCGSGRAGWSARTSTRCGPW